MQRSIMNLVFGWIVLICGLFLFPKDGSAQSEVIYSFETFPTGDWEVTHGKDSSVLVSPNNTLRILAAPGDEPVVIQNKAIRFSQNKDFSFRVKARILKAKEPYVAEPISVLHSGTHYLHMHMNRIHLYENIEGLNSNQFYADYNLLTGDVISQSGIEIDKEYHDFTISNKAGNLIFAIDGIILNSWDKIGAPNLQDKEFHPTILLLTWSDEPAIMEIQFIQIIF